ncbi:hypothetical protein OV090_48825 [Nannocystis sp. RBIL2]|nr:hypothetical protein [Nannocystis sp. RBIL2]MCY1072746.1 hypothetical protein [Nannocystis sp. RBIL2]
MRPATSCAARGNTSQSTRPVVTLVVEPAVSLRSIDESTWP